jgi:hypothetical protein
VNHLWFRGGGEVIFIPAHWSMRRPQPVCRPNGCSRLLGTRRVFNSWRTHDSQRSPLPKSCSLVASRVAQYGVKDPSLPLARSKRNSAPRL